jgi:hypothetical protein
MHGWEQPAEGCLPPYRSELHPYCKAARPCSYTWWLGRGCLDSGYRARPRLISCCMRACPGGAPIPTIGCAPHNCRPAAMRRTRRPPRPRPSGRPAAQAAAHQRRAQPGIAARVDGPHAARRAAARDAARVGPGRRARVSRLPAALLPSRQACIELRVGLATESRVRTVLLAALCARAGERWSACGGARVSAHEGWALCTPRRDPFRERLGSFRLLLDESEEYSRWAADARRRARDAAAAAASTATVAATAAAKGGAGASGRGVDTVGRPHETKERKNYFWKERLLFELPGRPHETPIAGAALSQVRTRALAAGQKPSLVEASARTAHRAASVGGLRVSAPA